MALHHLKVAAAVAVIRSKPDEADIYSYTQQLCSKYLLSQTEWRRRCLQAQDALLQFKQQEAVCLSEHHGANEHIGGLPPTPPSSGQGADIIAVSMVPETKHQVLLSSYQFIRSVLSLASIAQEDSAELTSSVTRGERERRATPRDLQVAMNSLLTETVPTCVRHLRQIVCDRETNVSTLCVMQGLDGLLMLLSSDLIGCGNNTVHENVLLEQLGGLVDDILHLLFEEKALNVRTRNLLHQMLVRLATKVRVPEKYCLIHSVAAHAKTMCATLSCGLHTDMAMIPNCYDSLAIALDCVQQGVKSLRVEQLQQESLREVQRELESALEQPLVRHFPLIAYTVFRLTSVIELCIKSETL